MSRALTLLLALSLAARQFARMTPETQGEKQERFDRLDKALEALAARFP